MWVLYNRALKSDGQAVRATWLSLNCVNKTFNVSGDSYSWQNISNDQYGRAEDLYDQFCATAGGQPTPRHLSLPPADSDLFRSAQVDKQGWMVTALSRWLKTQHNLGQGMLGAGLRKGVVLSGWRNGSGRHRTRFPSACVARCGVTLKPSPASAPSPGSRRKRSTTPRRGSVAICPSPARCHHRRRFAPDFNLKGTPGHRETVRTPEAWMISGILASTSVLLGFITTDWPAPARKPAARAGRLPAVPSSDHLLCRPSETPL